MNGVFSQAITQMVNGAAPMLQAGGAKAAPSSTGSGFLLFVVALIVLFIKAFIVQFAYAQIVPKLVATLSENPEKSLPNFRPLTYLESLWLVLLVGALF